MSFFTHLECGMRGKHLANDQIWNLRHDCEKPLLARYDLDASKKPGRSF